MLDFPASVLRCIELEPVAVDGVDSLLYRLRILLDVALGSALAIRASALARKKVRWFLFEPLVALMAQDWELGRILSELTDVYRVSSGSEYFVSARLYGVDAKLSWVAAVSAFGDVTRVGFVSLVALEALQGDLFVRAFEFKNLYCSVELILNSLLKLCLGL